MLATLALELASANCKNVFELARKRHQSVSDVWRDVCRKTGQPRCTVPQGVTRPDYIATAPSHEISDATSPSAASSSAATTSSANGIAPAAVHATATTPVKSAAAATTAGHALSGRTIAVGAGLSAILVIGIGLIIAMPRGADHTASTARPTEAVRAKANEPARAEQQTVVAPPQGTTRRMEEINKAFTKR